MFNKGIHGTILTSEVADRLFFNITASGALDQSFLATLRVLLHSRLPQNETARLVCKAMHFSESEILSASVVQNMNWFVPDEPSSLDASGHHIYIAYTTQPGAGEKMLEIIKANAGKGKRYMNDYIRQDDLQVFYARKVKALFYTDDIGMNTIIFAGKMELKHFHALQMMIPKYLPRLFADNPLTETEAALLKSLGNKSVVEYESLIEQFVRPDRA
jgi:hypothetical protein